MWYLHSFWLIFKLSLLYFFIQKKSVIFIDKLLNLLQEMMKMLNSFGCFANIHQFNAFLIVLQNLIQLNFDMLRLLPFC